MTRKRVVIVGAGFAGLAVARKLAGKSVDVLLLNSENYHTFSPLLHQVATAAIAPTNTLYPLHRAIGKSNHIRCITTTVKRVNFHKQLLEVERDLIKYDYLVIACGTKTNYGQVAGAAEFGFALKNIHDAVNLRNHILTCWERSQNPTHKPKSCQLLTFCIVGGGATGVELAADLADWTHNSLSKDYPNTDVRRVRIVLLQRGQQLLPELSPQSGDYARRKLQSMGVEIRFHSQVNKVTADALYLDDGRVIPTKTVIWTAGVRSHPLLERWGLTAENGQIEVLPTLQHPHINNLYLIGDIAAPTLQQPMVASTAIAQGKWAAENIQRQIQGRTPQPLHHQHPGTMVVLGRNYAIAEIGKIRLQGLIAWILWLQVHLVYLPGIRNRIQVFIHWIYSYILRDRPIKVILSNSHHTQSVKEFQEISHPHRKIRSRDDPSGRL